MEPPIDIPPPPPPLGSDDHGTDLSAPDAALSCSISWSVEAGVVLAVKLPIVNAVGVVVDAVGLPSIVQAPTGSGPPLLPPPGAPANATMSQFGDFVPGVNRRWQP